MAETKVSIMENVPIRVGKYAHQMILGLIHHEYTMEYPIQEERDAFGISQGQVLVLISINCASDDDRLLI